MSFERFEEQIVGATDADAQRALASEIGRWRAQHLTDVPALRDAAYAMSRLFVLLGDQDSARREAHSLVSLCQTPPEARPPELRDARAWLTSLGGEAVVATPSRNRRERGERGDRKDRKGRERGNQVPLREIAAKVNAGKVADALALLDGRGGDRATLLATWARVRHIRSADAGSREQLLAALDARLGEIFFAQGGRTERAPRAEQAERDDRPKADTDSPLAKLVGGPVPFKRNDRIAVLEAFLDEHPDKTDILAATALREHVASQGRKRPSPWMFTFAVRALATGGAETRSAIRDLGDAFAVTAYSEAPVAGIVSVLSEALNEDWSATNVRRGVLPKGGEPHDRKVWTARLNDGFTERMLAVASPQGLGELSGKVARRVAELAPIAVLWASGPQHAELRAAAQAVGLPTVDGDSPAEVLAALKGATPREIAARPPRDSGPAAAAEAKAPREPKAPKRDLKAELTALLTADELDVDALNEVVAAHRKVRFALNDGAAVLQGLDAAARDARGAALLMAAHLGAPENVLLSRGVSLSVELASANPTGAVAALLTDGPTAARYGGPGIGDLVTIAAAAAEAGWLMHRTFRGPTGREKREDAVLTALDGNADSLWRLVLRKGEDEAEVWFLGADTPEARATMPRLLQRDAKRVVVLPVDGDLLSWYGALGGPEAIGWTGDEAGEVVGALG